MGMVRAPAPTWMSFAERRFLYSPHLFTLALPSNHKSIPVTSRYASVYIKMWRQSPQSRAGNDGRGS